MNRKTLGLAALLSLVCFVAVWALMYSPASPFRPDVVQADGGNTSCAVMSDGGLLCWGHNEDGQLGTGSAEGSSPTPARVQLNASAKQVSTRTFHTCATLVDGTIQCWGRNSRGQLGNGTTQGSAVPVTVTSIKDAAAVATGVFHTCALHTTGKVSCWGYNDYGQIGNGTFENQLVPASVPGISDAVAIAAGGDHSCAVLSSGSIKCWGWNAQGQIGTGADDEQYEYPVKVAGISDAVDVSAGDYFTCAVLSKGKIRCWGLNGESRFPVTERRLYSGMLEGSLGNGDFLDSSMPVEVIGIDTAVEVEAGYTSACALLRDGKVKCWGRNLDGQLGTGAVFPASNVPLDAAIDDAVRLGGSECAILASDQLRCWGHGYHGQLGMEERINSPTPVGIGGL